MPSPLDEYPVHQAPLSLRSPATSDRNFYDRCYFNAHDRTGDVFLVTGLGVYPNLGVIDAYAVVRRGDHQHAVRCSGSLPDNRLAQQVGHFRVEVLEPLQRVRIACEADDLGYDLTWQASFPAIDEPRHVLSAGPRRILDAARFAQVGTWTGELRLAGERWEVRPEQWVGTRDRSWGIRPVGEPEPAGRPAPVDGFWWLYAPLRFDDYALVVICQEDATGYRSLSAAVRVDAAGRVEQLGWPRVDIRYAPGTRAPQAATLHLTDRAGAPVTVDVETRCPVPLNVGAGYGGDPDWGHGQWRGDDWRSGQVYDLTDPAVAGRVPFGVVDHVARATCDGAEGWGLFEHGSIGRHDPSGFADWAAVAP